MPDITTDQAGIQLEALRAVQPILLVALDRFRGKRRRAAERAEALVSAALAQAGPLPVPEPEYTTAEVAAMLSLTPQTIRDKAERGKLLGAYRPGGMGRWRFPQSAVEAFRAGRQVKDQV